MDLSGFHIEQDLLPLGVLYLRLLYSKSGLLNELASFVTEHVLPLVL